MCFFLFCLGTINMIIPSFNSEAISSHGKIKIKSTFSAVLFKAFQPSTEIHTAGLLFLFCCIKIILF